MRDEINVSIRNFIGIAFWLLEIKDGEIKEIKKTW